MRKTLEKRRITPAYAKSMLEFNTHAAQRRMNRRRVDELVKKLRDGRFTFARLAFCTTKDETILINGQHQLTAIIEAGISVDGTVEDHWLEAGEGKEVLAKVFAQYDEGGMRTAGQVAWAFAQAYGLGDMDMQAVARCCSAITWLKFNGSAKGRITKDERAALLKNQRPRCKFAEKIGWSIKNTNHGSRAGSKLITRVPAVAAMMVTFDVDHGAAERFWTGVRDGNSASLTIRQLRDWLMTHKIGNGKASPAAPEGATTSAKEAYARCLHAWNKCRRPKKPLGRYYHDKPSPKAL